MKQRFYIVESSCVPLPVENIDTDQIIPARFLKATTKDERFFGKNLFRDWRFRPDGSADPSFPLNNPLYQGEILLAGDNFGCGSSREHAAWALAGYGFKVVISSSFADIHKINELNNFVLPVQVSAAFLSELFETVMKNPRAKVRVDVPRQTVTDMVTGKTEDFELNQYKKYCLMNALDDIDFLLLQKDKIEAFENNRII
ncbi:MAG: 3-isopropylmalate dehydratase small subunit [Bacteroidales bacterium]|nr:3-isopropylmalate dehydratase small subunit [Bacteroidales bacterium]